MLKPPVLFGSALLLGVVLSATVPLGAMLGSANTLAAVVGLLFVVAGFVLAALALRRIVGAARGSEQGRGPALATGGVYAVTRNPLYIGLVLIYFGLAILLTSLWVLVLLAPVLFILQRHIVLPEEAALEASFGDTYRQYQRRVPRWL